jgi:hypothetical protein
VAAEIPEHVISAYLDEQGSVAAAAPLPPDKGNILFQVASDVLTSYGKNAANYHYHVVRFGLGGPLARLHSTRSILRAVRVRHVAPVQTWYNVRIQPLGPWIDAELLFPNLKVAVQFGHHMCIRGVAEFVDDSVLPFTYELFAPDPDAVFDQVRRHGEILPMFFTPQPTIIKNHSILCSTKGPLRCAWCRCSCRITCRCLS